MVGSDIERKKIDWSLKSSFEKHCLMTLAFTPDCACKPIHPVHGSWPGLTKLFAAHALIPGPVNQNIY